MVAGGSASGSSKHFFFGRWRWPQRYLRTTELPMEQCRLQRAVATWRVAGCELFYLLLPTGGRCTGIWTARHQAPVRQSGYRCAGRCCRAAYFCCPPQYSPRPCYLVKGSPLWSTVIPTSTNTAHYVLQLTQTIGCCG